MFRTENPYDIQDYEKIMKKLLMKVKGGSSKEAQYFIEQKVRPAKDDYIKDTQKDISISQGWVDCKNYYVKLEGKIESEKEVF